MLFLIIDLAVDYSHAVIGYPNRNYVWIMARNLQLPEDTYTAIIQKLEGVGYDISTIEMVPQQW